MRLTDLSPQWIMRDGKRIGFVFKSPTKPDFWQSCFEIPPQRRDQMILFAEMIPENRGMIQGCNPAARWTIAGGIDAASFESMTVTPSLDGSAGGLWHGFITSGAIVGGI